MTGKTIKKKSKEVGLPPGTLIYVGEKKSETVRIRQIVYNECYVSKKFSF